MAKNSDYQKYPFETKTGYGKKHLSGVLAAVFDYSKNAKKRHKPHKQRYLTS